MARVSSGDQRTWCLGHTFPYLESEVKHDMHVHVFDIHHQNNYYYLNNLRAV